MNRHIRYISLFFALLSSVVLCYAQTTDLPIDSVDSELLDEMLREDSLSLAGGKNPLVEYEQTQLDMALMDWSLAWLDTTDCSNELPDEVLTDSLCKARLQALPCVIEMPYNAVVRGFIDMYVNRRRRQLATLQRLSEYYFPMFEDKLCAYGLPDELKYLAVIESALNASAHSRAGAAGLWQFMPATGKLYGLEVNSLVDERLDPYKSTDAACRFLRSLYTLFGDWNLAIAAYNCGPGNINKAIKRSGGKHDFWAIYPYLPRETRSYLPIFIAANYAMNYADVHGICPDTIHDNLRLRHRDQYMPLLTDTILTDRRQHLLQTAVMLGVPIEELRKLNPQYQKDVLPGGKYYSLVLPLDLMGPYLENQDSIVAYKADSLINNRRAEIQVAQQTSTSGAYSSGGWTYYKVKKGDTLGAIAKRFHTSVANIQKWNNLKSTNIQIGQTLKLK